MEGRGVTNFSADKPSHGFTTRTTEFDDALIQRGIVTTEQAMMAKGASAEDAVRLAEEKRQQQQPQYDTNENTKETKGSNNNSDMSDEDSDFDDDDAFLQEYRQQRMNQWKKERESNPHSSSQSRILHIGRDDWKRAVNEASAYNWVVVTMVEASGDRRDRVVQELQKFANEFNHDDDEKPMPSLVTIAASDAIPNWPQDRVPAMFAYRHGVKQHEWIAGTRGEFPPSKILEQVFQTWKVI